MRFDGWLNIDKPPGMTSYGVIARLKRLTGQRHIGHAGTLDPLATGVLPVAFGRAARTIEFLHQVSKTYRAVIELGVETDTLDAEGKVIFRADASHIDSQAIEITLKPFIGKIEQVPPMFSALKRNGTPLYELARRGETVEIKPRLVTIYRLDLIDFTSPLITLDVDCGSGTYIRSIARDLGQSLGVGAHLKSLRRTRYGMFDLSNSVTLDSLVTPDDVDTAVLPVDFAICHLRYIEIDEVSAEQIIHGIVTPEIRSRLPDNTAYRLYRSPGELIALVDVTTDNLRLKVLAQNSVDS
jgi:tRNA pseudouridine55 synthase